MKETERIGGELELKPFSSLEATAVNELFGILKKGILRPEEMPPVLDLTQWWKITKPIIDCHPQDRELSLSWELGPQGLEIVQKNIGQTYEEINQDSDFNFFGFFSDGQVKIKPSALVFHSHVRSNFRSTNFGEPASAIERFLEDIPRTMIIDVGKFLVHPSWYASVVVDLGQREPLLPVLVLYKSLDTPIITNDNYDDIYGRRMGKIFADQVSRSDQTQAWKRYFGLRHRPRYLDILLRDHRWKKHFGIVIYRGFLSENLEEAQIVRRSDTRLPAKS